MADRSLAHQVDEMGRGPTSRSIDALTPEIEAGHHDDEWRIEAHRMMSDEYEILAQSWEGW